MPYDPSTHGNPAEECALTWWFHYNFPGCVSLPPEAPEPLTDLLIGWAESLELCIAGGCHAPDPEPIADRPLEPDMEFWLFNPLPDAVVNRDMAERMLREVIVPWAKHFGLTLEGGFAISLPAPAELLQARRGDLENDKGGL